MFSNQPSWSMWILCLLGSAGKHQLVYRIPIISLSLFANVFCFLLGAPLSFITFLLFPFIIRPLSKRTWAPLLVTCPYRYHQDQFSLHFHIWPAFLKLKIILQLKCCRRNVHRNFLFIFTELCILNWVEKQVTAFGVLNSGTRQGGLWSALGYVHFICHSYQGCWSL